MQRYGPFSCILRIRLEIANLQGISFAIEKTPRISLSCNMSDPFPSVEAAGVFLNFYKERLVPLWRREETGGLIGTER